MKFIAGSGRSGTTWILDCLALANQMRPVFEPLHPDAHEVASRYAYCMLDAVKEYPELRQYLQKVQAPGYWSTWTTYRCFTDQLFPNPRQFLASNTFKKMRYRWKKLLPKLPQLTIAAAQREPLIKCIRANLALEWLVRHEGAKAILVVRHPCAVVESQYRLGRTGVWNPWPTIQRLKEDRRFRERGKEAYFRLWNEELSDLEAMTLLWVMENQIPIEIAGNSGYSVVYYEDLVADPDRAWRVICSALALSHVPDEQIRERPSQQTSDTSQLRDAATDGWANKLSSEELRQIQRILDATGFESYNVENSQPHSSAKSSAA